MKNYIVKPTVLAPPQHLIASPTLFAEEFS